MLPVLASGLALGAVALAPRLRTVMVETGLKMPELGNPANLRVALGFGALYAFILLGSAWLSELAGNLGLYAIAAASGFVDVDAITLSSLNLLHGGSVSVAVATTVVGIAFASNVVVKLALVLFLGGRDLAKRCAPALVASAIGVAAGLLLFS
jgi:uncharacterized membrane protein (DUF4010 family)